MRLLFFIVFFSFGAHANAESKLVEVQWPTKSASPPPVLSKDMAAWLPAFRASLSFLPESSIVKLAISQPQLLGLPKDMAAQLLPLIEKQYELISKDAGFAKASSHLSYCFSEARPAQGLARVSYPAVHGKDTPVLLFLHGYGGSFIWYHHWLAAKFPDHIIICPAYGMNTSTISSTYLSECLQAVEKQLGQKFQKPSLIGLSAGGFGALRVFQANPGHYRQLIVLAAYPQIETIGSFHRDTKASFLAGADEYYVLDGTWIRSINALKRRLPGLTSDTVPKANHFFMLTHSDETARWLHVQLDALK